MVCELNKEPAKRGGGRKKKDPSLYSMTPAAIRMRAVVARRKEITGRTASPNAKRQPTKREMRDAMVEAPGLKPALTADYHKSGISDSKHAWGYGWQAKINKACREFFLVPGRELEGMGVISNSVIDFETIHFLAKDDVPGFDGKRNTRGWE